MMNNIKNGFVKEECCGCSACFYSCPVKAISMVKDKKGFLYPSVDNSICISCGSCISVCDFRKNNAKGNLLKSIACKYNDRFERMSSTSGAAFQVLVDYILARNGMVFGCELSNSNEVIHSFSDDFRIVQRFKKSKYVLSNMRDCFLKCLNFLNQDRYVLFSGTGCQIASLLSFLNFKNVNTKKLITCDIVCHGCPSPDVWSEFINALENKEKSKIVNVLFRNKDFGWHSHVETYFFDNNKTLSSDKWASMFHSNILFRESCYNCKYTTAYRNSDFTIADCWGIDKNNKQFDDNEGVSLVMFHTKKALSLLEDFNVKTQWFDINLENYFQPQLYHPVHIGKHYYQFWNSYLKNKQRTIKKYFFRSKLRLLLQEIKDKCLKVIKRNDGSNI